MERLRLTSLAVKQPQTPSVRFCDIPNNAWQENGKFYGDLRNTSILELMKYYCVHCRCSSVTMLIKLSSYATWRKKGRQ